MYSVFSRFINDLHIPQWCSTYLKYWDQSFPFMTPTCTKPSLHPCYKTERHYLPIYVSYSASNLTGTMFQCFKLDTCKVSSYILENSSRLLFLHDVSSQDICILNWSHGIECVFIVFSVFFFFSFFLFYIYIFPIIGTHFTVLLFGIGHFRTLNVLFLYTSEQYSSQNVRTHTNNIGSRRV